jgi:CotH protein/lamin tail-like protein
MKFTSLILCVLVVIGVSNLRAELVINEVVAQNFKSLLDDENDNSDWIELYNNGSEDIDLEGYRISDKSNFVGAWKFPKRIIEPGEYLIVYPSDKNRTESDIYAFRTKNGDISQFNNIDRGLFAYKEITGDFTISVKILSMPTMNPFAYCGIVIRESLDPRAKYFSLMSTSSGVKEARTLNRLNEGEYPEAGHLSYRIDYGEYNLFIKRENEKIFLKILDDRGDVLHSELRYVELNEILYVGLSYSNRDNTKFEWAYLKDLYIKGMKTNFASLTQTIIGDAEGEFFKADQLHTDFKLKNEGETVFLWDDTGKLIDELTYKNLRPDVSSGIDSENNQALFVPSPRMPNGMAYLGYSPDPKFNKESGFYLDDIDIDFENDSENYKIHFSLDGNSVSDTSSLWDEKRINLDETTVARAIGYKDGYLPSKRITKTFFIDYKPELPVISLTIDNHDLYSTYDGILLDRNMYSSREGSAHVSFWEDEEELYNTDCGVKLHGGATRFYDQQSLRIYSRSGYGMGDFPNEFWDDVSMPEYDKLIIRNGGQDWYGAMLRDGYVAFLCKGLEHVDGSDYKAHSVYLNGEYRGLFNLRPRMDNDYFAMKYDIEEESINNIENGKYLHSGNIKQFNIDYDKIMAIPAEEANSYDNFNELIYIKNLIDYTVAEMYAGNHDWYDNNIRCWNSKEYDNGRWRWFLYDMDLCFGLMSSEPDKRNFLMIFEKNDFMSVMYQHIFKNEQFRNEFINRYSDMSNTIFLCENADALTDSLSNIIKNEVPKQQARWEESIPDWQGSIDHMKYYSANRHFHIRNQIVDQFELSAHDTLTLNSNLEGACTFKLNTIEIKELPWEGVYFEGIPVELTVLPHSGYEFIGWSDASFGTETKISLDIALVNSITAIFKQGEPKVYDIIINEIMHNAPDTANTKDWVELYNNSGVAADISYWKLYDDGEEAFVFPENTILDNKEYLIVCRSTEDFIVVHPDVTPVIGNFSFGLSASDQVRLYNYANELIDSISYDAEYWQNATSGTGSSLELKNFDPDRTNPDNWYASLVGNGTPGRKNSVSVGVQGTIPSSTSTLACYPNPVSSQTLIKFQLDDGERYSLELVDMMGQSVASIANGVYSQSSYVVYNFDQIKDQVGAGAYLLVLRSEGSLQQMLVIME